MRGYLAGGRSGLHGATGVRTPQLARAAVGRGIGERAVVVLGQGDHQDPAGVVSLMTGTAWPWSGAAGALPLEVELLLSPSRIGGLGTLTNVLHGFHGGGEGHAEVD